MRNALAGIVGLTASIAQASLILNGGFEDTPVNGGGGGWQWYTSAQVDGWEGDNLEIWRDFGAIGPYEGEQHAELNAHAGGSGSYSIYQSFSTIEGNPYNLFFAYGARRSNEERFRVEVASLDLIMDDHEVNQWSTFSTDFVATGSETTLRFTSVRPESGTVGNFLDDIRVTGLFDPTNPSGQVPLPSTFALLGLGLLFMRVKHRARNHG